MAESYSREVEYRHSLFRELSRTDIEIARDADEKYVMIGFGGFAVVYEGRYHNIGDHTKVAIKRIIGSEKGMHPKVVGDLKNEAKMMFRAKNNRVVDIYGLVCDDSNQEDHFYALVVEYMENGSLYDLLDQEIWLPWSVRTRILIDAAEGLVWLHSILKVHHGDIKASNILIDRNYGAKIADFGLSRLCGITSRSTQNKFRGTPTHFPPERCRRMKGKLDREKADVWSFGVTIYETIADSAEKRLPFDPEADAHQICDQIKTDGLFETDQLEAIPSSCPKFIIELMQKCCQNEPEKRPDFKEIICDLKRGFDDNFSRNSYGEDFIQLMTSLYPKSKCDSNVPNSQLDPGPVSIKRQEKSNDSDISYENRSISNTGDNSTIQQPSSDASVVETEIAIAARGGDMPSRAPAADFPPQIEEAIRTHLDRVTEEFTHFKGEIRRQHEEVRATQGAILFNQGVQSLRIQTIEQKQDEQSHIMQNVEENQERQRYETAQMFETSRREQDASKQEVLSQLQDMPKRSELAGIFPESFQKYKYKHQYLADNIRYIRKKLDVQKVMVALLNTGILKEEDRHRVNNTTDHEEQVEIITRHIDSLGAEAVKQFQKVLGENQPGLANHLECCKRMKRSIEHLENYLRLDGIIIKLFSQDILGFDDKQEIDALPTTKKKVNTLVNIIMDAGREGFECFIDALRETSQDDLAELLTKTTAE